jgi:DNA-binding transcriptional ArsR family regulator
MFKELNILKIFFESPAKEFNVREAARALNIAPATASSQLKLFAKEGFLSERKERNLILYKANLDNPAYTEAKRYYNVLKIRESGIIEELDKFYIKPAIIMFGSASEGLDVENSDIDLVIISENTKHMNVEKFEKKLNREIQLFAIKNIKDLQNPHLINNALNGTVIQGEIKWI